jgi:hypothetical protein
MLKLESLSLIQLLPALTWRLCCAQSAYFSRSAEKFFD